MFKVTPNPPQAPTDAKLHAAAQRAIDHYLHPSDDAEPAARPCGNLFSVSPDVDTETLLANAAETLSSANEMVSNLAFELEGSKRAVALGIQQLIELSSLLADRALEQVAPTTAG
ncbi:DUF6124 family protein [Pseudomonas sp. SED1]|jgi:hypothetical protein|uniref:DUF6124 family protein n=1 Tax=Pseudomonas sp. SED1 TaxID=3056845 RepID=UPI00296EC1C7|nr:DUF6124 family protein [Pseudomonas sp. SED1]MDY0835639.1 DUF6124 family protein [Pseudomonas sp. SED1]